MDSGNPQNSGIYQIKVTEQSPDWTSFLLRQAGATIYQNPRWGEIMRQAYGNPAYYLTVRSGGDIAGILTLVLQRSVLFGSHLCSVPYFDAAGILTEDSAAEAMLLDQACKLMRNQKSPWLELRQDRLLGGDLPCRKDKVTMVVSLPATSEELWTELTTKVRNKVRKAHTYHGAIEPRGRELLPEF